MRLNFKKVSAIAASALMVGMTMGVAAAAQNYPNPFVISGNANVAIVYGTGAGVSTLDLVQAGNIESNLQSFMATTGTSTNGVSGTGEYSDLSGNGNGIYVNDSITTNGYSTLTKYNLPTVLADVAFSGNVDATGTSTISINAYPRVVFQQQPSSTDDAKYSLLFGTSTSTQAYNETISFNKAVNFTDANSKGKTITLFGQKYTISSSTDANNLILFQSSQRVDLTLDLSSATASSPNAVAPVTVGGKQYTVQLISASSTSATIKVTDATGYSETSSAITSGSSSKVNGVTFAVISSTGQGNIATASIVAGANKVTLPVGGTVTYGDQATPIQGTLVDAGGNNWNNCSKLNVRVSGSDVNKDAVISGGSFVDPVFGTFQLSSPGFNIEQNSTQRENIVISPSGSSAVGIDFIDYRGYEKSFPFAENLSTLTTIPLSWSSNGYNISVAEKQAVHLNDYVMLGNENQANLVQITNVANSSSTYTLYFQDVFSGATYTANIPASGDGTGTVNIGSKQYSVAVWGDPAVVSNQMMNVSINSPDSSGNDVILFPSIQTSKGAKVIFATKQTLNISNWQASSNYTATMYQNNN